MHCFSADQNAIQYLVNVAASVASCIGCTFVVIVYLRFKNLQVFAFKLVAVLALFDIGHDLSFLLPTYSGDPDTICIVQSVSLSFFSLASVLWTGAISLTLYLAVVTGRQEAGAPLKTVLILIPTLSAALALLPLLTASYGPAASWCWVKEDDLSGTYWSLGLFYVPLWGIFIANSVSYLAILRVEKTQLGESNEEAHSKRNLVARLGSYPLVLVLCFTPITITRTYEFFVDCPPVELYYISGFCASLVGGLNSFIYGFNKNVRVSLSDWWHIENDSLLAVSSSMVDSSLSFAGTDF